jgi:phosphoserine aminotransferase
MCVCVYVQVPNADWISDDRKGLTFNDATSAVFAMDIPWDKVDVTTYSWQKVRAHYLPHTIQQYTITQLTHTADLQSRAASTLYASRSMLLSSMLNTAACVLLSAHYVKRSCCYQYYYCYHTIIAHRLLRATAA